MMKTLRAVTGTHWFRIGTVSVLAAGVLTALFALAGHSHISITLQSALVHAAGMTVLVSLTVPRLRDAMDGRPAAARWTVKLTTLLMLALVGTAVACGVIGLLGVRPA